MPQHSLVLSEVEERWHTVRCLRTKSPDATLQPSLVLSEVEGRVHNVDAVLDLSSAL